MLRITVHEDGNVRRLELAGRLEGPWVAETENAWRASLRPDQKIEIDLRQLTAVDDAGRDLLAVIQRAGASLIVQGVWMTALIGELSSQQPCDGAKPQLPARERSRRATFRQQESSK
jgi:ABC-type transporter Mla MlaB component